MYQTILNKISKEIIIDKSRFIAHLCPVNSEDEAKAFIEEIKQQHRQATHNVPVYVLGEKYHIQRYSDDGEPSGTAGVPVLEMYKKMGVTNICSVTTRYFGGIKLGTGGLVRAYTKVIKEALENNLVTVNTYTFIIAKFGYSDYSKIEYLLNSNQAQIGEVFYTDNITLHFYVEPNQSEQIKSKLIDITSNQIEIIEEQVHGAIVEGKLYIVED